MKQLFALFVILAPACTIAAEYSKVQPEVSSITFVSKQMSVPVEGSFNKFTALIRINPAKP